MSKRTFTTLARVLTTAFVKLRLLQVFMLCAAVLVCVKLERVYSISNSIFVHSAQAAEAPEQPKENPPATPAKAMPVPEKTAAPADNSGFPTEKPKEGFKTENFDILELSPDQVEVLRTLSKRHRDLVQRERTISEREATLQAIEQRLDKKTDELKKIQEFLQQLLGQKSEKEKEALKKLVIVYEKMKPQEAATILQGLDHETLLSIMDEMKDGKVSAIIAKMDPPKARMLTRELAQRRQRLEERMRMQHETNNGAQAELTPTATPPTAADPAHPAAPDVGKPVLPQDAPKDAKSDQSSKPKA